MKSFRIRVSGILIENDQVLLVQQKTSDREYAIPGGGVEFDESIDKALIREFKEETGLTIGIKGVAYISEYLKGNITHVVEIAFTVFRTNPDEKIVVGSEPDSTGHQISNSQMIPVSELENFGMGRLAKFLSDKSLVGQYTGFRSE